MKKFVSTILAFACVFSCLLCGSTLTANAVSNDIVLIKEDHKTFRDGNYSGTQIASHIDVGEFANFNIVKDGGNHIDGEGNQVYSNYVVFGIDLNFDPSTKLIGNTGVKVSRDTCDWNETPYSSSGDTEQYIAYGAISATKTDGEGNVFKYEPMFSKGNTSVDNMIFNEDGDYTVFVLFETVKNGKYQNHVLSWSFKIRSYIYLVDKETGFPIKESDISSKPIILDYAGRSNIAIECIYTNESGSSSHKNVGDGEELYQNGKYSFTVTSNGFVSEKFDFCIDTTNPTSKIFFANLRKQIGDYTYEAEEYFYLNWTESPYNPITITYDYYDYSSETPITNSYVMGTVLDQSGLYHIKATMPTHPKPIEYLIQVVESDKPSYNYDTLSGERFNNFKTKWYEVYDDINGRFLCFDMSEYDKAYEAAMTIENSSVSTSSGKLYYNGNWYADRIGLTAAMHEYATKYNITIVYYDPLDYTLSEESERTFSVNAFDRTIYLNDDFQFVFSHGSESQTVIAVDENGKTYDEIKYFVEMNKQEGKGYLPHGKYTITETDMYGNDTTYTAYRDKMAPEVSITSSNGYSVNCENEGIYSANGNFSISKFEDEFDSYAVLKIVRPDASIVYYYQNECQGIVFEQKGDYSVTAYDRNNNTITLTVTVN